MNIFYLDHNPTTVAKWLNDRHIVKMVEESAQMLSTAHRLLSGTLTIVEEKGNDGKFHKKKFWLLPGEKPFLTQTRDEEGSWVCKWIVPDPVCYQAAHANHPSTAWTRETKANYVWHFDLLVAMMEEYSYRYEKNRQVSRLLDFLSSPPPSIPDGKFTPPPQAMPDIYKGEDTIQAYRRFYSGTKWPFSKWTKRDIPPWFFSRMQEAWLMDKSEERLIKVNNAIQAKTPSADRRILLTAVELTREIYQTVA